MADPVTGAVLASSASGQLNALVPNGHGEWVTQPPLDLGVNLLVDRRDAQLSLRRGAVDASGRALWLPVGQLTPLSGAFTHPTPSTTRAQWLCRIDLRQLLGR
jgi:hypothetical protein